MKGSFTAVIQGLKVVGSHSLCTVNQDDKTFSIKILILHGQSQSWHMYPVKERQIIPFLPNIFLRNNQKRKPRQLLLQQLKSETSN